MEVIKTQAQIDRIKFKDEPRYYSIQNYKGLYLYVGARKKTLLYRFKFEAKLYSITYKSYDLKEVRKRYFEDLEAVEKGINPKKPKTNEPQKLKDIYSQFKQNLDTSYSLQNQSVDKRIIAHFGDMKLSELTKQIVVQFLNLHSYSVAKQFKARLNKVLEYASNLGLIESNPLKDFQVSAIKKPTQIISHKALEFELIKEAVHTLENSKNLKQNLKNALLFALCVPLRANEIRLIKRDFFNPQTNTLLIPKEYMKQHTKAYEVELRGKALEYFLRAYNQDKEYVFSYSQDKPFGENVITKAFKRTLSITTHQTRSTFSTYCNSRLLELRERNITENDIELALNHSIGNKVQRTYNQSTAKALVTNILEWYQAQIHSQD